MKYILIYLSAFLITTKSFAGLPGCVRGSKFQELLEAYSMNVNAVIGVNIYRGKDTHTPLPNEYFDYFNTFTDENCFFKI